MKIQPYLDKLNQSIEFKDFTAKNPEAYFSAGFFVIDFQEKVNLHQLDYYLPKENKIATFMLDKEIKLKTDETTSKIAPKKIETNINLDLDILKGIIEDEMKNHNITHKLQKIIAIIQNLDGKLIWNLNCITSDMGVLKVHIEDATHSVLKFEPVSLFDVVKKLN
ncbi:MAG: hypothetical protein U9Q06_00075 [Nanoarchaeota archaeon]|nr:hypothetical protein [Nanoarchaeota archaeon]